MDCQSCSVFFFFFVVTVNQRYITSYLKSVHCSLTGPWCYYPLSPLLPIKVDIHIFMLVTFKSNIDRRDPTIWLCQWWNSISIMIRKQINIQRVTRQENSGPRYLIMQQGKGFPWIPFSRRKDCIFSFYLCKIRMHIL